MGREYQLRRRQSTGKNVISAPKQEIGGWRQLLEIGFSPAIE
jgi:hypothetical protein